MLIHKDKKRVLFVDDCEDLRIVIGSFLQNSGFQVALAENGKQALERLVSYDEELWTLITDYNMPIMDGRELIQSIISLKINVRKVLVCSAYVENEDFLHGLGTHNLEISFIHKPFPPAKLLEAIAGQ